jgi:hypothetical protein
VVAATTVTGSQHLIPGVVAGVIGLFDALQDHAHCPKDVTGHTRIPLDSQEFEAGLDSPKLRTPPSPRRPASVTQSASTS